MIERTHTSTILITKPHHRHHHYSSTTSKRTNPDPSFCWEQKQNQHEEDCASTVYNNALVTQTLITSK
jgi:hypothetical protein